MCLHQKISRFFIFLFIFSASASKALDHIPSDAVLAQITELNKQGQIAQAWDLFAKNGDTYAIKAHKIFSDNTSLEHCTLVAHWDNVVGTDVRKEKFVPYGLAYQQLYLDFVKSKRRLPDTNEIENLYASIIDKMKFPRELSIDLVLNQAPNSKKKILSDAGSSLIGFGGVKLNKNWYDFVGIPPERISNLKTVSHLTSDKADALVWQDQVVAAKYCTKNILDAAYKKLFKKPTCPTNTQNLF